jgi:hypothetical protein
MLCELHVMHGTSIPASTSLATISNANAKISADLSVIAADYFNYSVYTLFAAPTGLWPLEHTRQPMAGGCRCDAPSAQIKPLE